MHIPTAQISEEFVAEALALLRRKVLRQPGHLQTGDTLRRKYEFGYSFEDMAKGDFSYTRIPDCLIALCTQGLRALKSAEECPPFPAARFFQNYILSIYEPGFKLEPHIDVNKPQAPRYGNHFHFGDHIFGLVLTADKNPCGDTGRLFFLNTTDSEKAKDPTLPRHYLNEQNGTVYALAGETRHLAHGVSEVNLWRLSLTSRTVFRPGQGLLLKPKSLTMPAA